MNNPPLLLSIQVGLPQTFKIEDNFDQKKHSWTTAIFKHPIQGPIWLGRTNLEGDGQADLRYHGGPDRALLGYAAAHYPIWREELNRPELAYGTFGENFTIAGLEEESICIGDTFAIGEAQIQVSQPRQPCWKLARRLGIKNMVSRVQKKGWGGWYFRVLLEGYVEQNLPLILLNRPFPQWTIAQTYKIMSKRKTFPQAASELAACPLLSQDWRNHLSNLT